MAEESLLEDAPRPAAKSGRRRRSRRAMSTEWRVRAAVYLTFLAVAAIALLEAWNSQGMNDRAHREAALQQRVTEARVEAHELAKLAVLMLTQTAERERALAELTKGVGHAAAAMPVIEQMLGGVLAGSGWLLAKGAFGIMVGGASLWHEPLRWAPAVGWALLMLLINRRAPHPLVMLSMVLLGIALFHGVARLVGWNASALAGAGWLLRAPATAQHAPLPFAIEWQAVEWSSLARIAGELATLPIVTAVALLLNGAGLETATKRPVDLNRELVAAGLANLASGSLGGLPGYQQLGLSAMNVRARAGTRWVGVWAALLALGALFFGTRALAWMPRAVLGALLLFMALSMARDWLLQSWGRLSALDHGIVALIVAVTVLVGFLPAVVVGLVTAVVLFTVHYGRIDPVRQDLSARSYGSRVTRPAPEQAALALHGGAIHVLQLQGFLFFGVADRLLLRARQQLHAAASPRLRFLVLDCRRVTGVDSSVAESISRLHELLVSHGAELVLTHAAGAVRAQFEAQGLSEARAGYSRFPDLDHGLEWCENRLLATTAVDAAPAQAGPGPESTDLRSLLVPHLGAQAVELLWPRLQRVTLRAGEPLIARGDAADHLYFLESGSLSALRARGDEPPVRLESSRALGAVIGEVGFYLRSARTAAVVADEPSVVYSLTAQELTRLEQEMPATAAALHRLVAERLAARVAHLVTVVDALEA